MNLAYWWSCIKKGLRLQPAQQACFSHWLWSCWGGPVTTYPLLSKSSFKLRPSLTYLQPQWFTWQGKFWTLLDPLKKKVRTCNGKSVDILQTGPKIYFPEFFCVLLLFTNITLLIGSLCLTKKVFIHQSIFLNVFTVKAFWHCIFRLRPQIGIHYLNLVRKKRFWYQIWFDLMYSTFKIIETRDKSNTKRVYKFWKICFVFCVVYKVCKCVWQNQPILKYSVNKEDFDIRFGLT